MPTFDPESLVLKYSVTVEITTTGFADRFLLPKQHRWTLTYRTDQAKKITVQFDNSMDILSFLRFGLGIESEAAYSIFEGTAPTVWITGYRDAVKKMDTIQIDKQQAKSIHALLKIRDAELHPDQWRAGDVLYNRLLLAQHPLGYVLTAIVDYQLAECDRMNVLAWGHPNGQEGLDPTKTYQNS